MTQPRRTRPRPLTPAEQQDPKARKRYRERERAFLAARYTQTPRTRAPPSAPSDDLAAQLEAELMDAATPPAPAPEEYHPAPATTLISGPRADGRPIAAAHSKMAHIQHHPERIPSGMSADGPWAPPPHTWTPLVPELSMHSVASDDAGPCHAGPASWVPECSMHPAFSSAESLFSPKRPRSPSPPPSPRAPWSDFDSAPLVGRYPSSAYPVHPLLALLPGPLVCSADDEPLRKRARRDCWAPSVEEQLLAERAARCLENERRARAEEAARLEEEERRREGEMIRAREEERRRKRREERRRRREEEERKVRRREEVERMRGRRVSRWGVPKGRQRKHRSPGVKPTTKLVPKPALRQTKRSAEEEDLVARATKLVRWTSSVVSQGAWRDWVPPVLSG